MARIVWRSFPCWFHRLFFWWLLDYNRSFFGILRDVVYIWLFTLSARIRRVHIWIGINSWTNTVEFHIIGVTWDPSIWLGPAIGCKEILLLRVHWWLHVHGTKVMRVMRTIHLKLSIIRVKVVVVVPMINIVLINMVEFQSFNLLILNYFLLCLNWVSKLFFICRPSIVCSRRTHRHTFWNTWHWWIWGLNLYRFLRYLPVFQIRFMNWTIAP